MVRFVASWVFRCPYWVYLKGKYPEFDRISRESVERGMEAERKFAEILASRGVRFSYQKWLTLKTRYFSIVGKADFVTGTEVYELKSVRRFREPRRNWIGQLNLYMAMSGRKSGAIVEYDGGEFRAYRLTFNRELLEESISYFHDIYSGKIRKDHSQCRYCSYSFICLK